MMMMETASFFLENRRLRSSIITVAAFEISRAADEDSCLR
jgi:hypothetical protein